MKVLQTFNIMMRGVELEARVRKTCHVYLSKRAAWTQTLTLSHTLSGQRVFTKSQ